MVRNTVSLTLWFGLGGRVVFVFSLQGWGVWIKVSLSPARLEGGVST